MKYSSRRNARLAGGVRRFPFGASCCELVEPQRIARVIMLPARIAAGLKKDESTMASVSSGSNGRRVLFIAPDGERRSVWLGKVSQRAAESIRFRIEELLEALHLNRPMEADLSQWVAKLEPRLAKKFARVGLIA